MIFKAKITFICAIAGPESPRVLEVVEKCDSLSWKLEYDGGSETEDNPSHSSASMHASSHHSNLRSSAGALVKFVLQFDISLSLIQFRFQKWDENFCLSDGITLICFGSGRLVGCVGNQADWELTISG